MTADEPVVVYACGLPADPSPELLDTLTALGRAAAEAEERRRLALTPAERAAEDACREAAHRRITERVARLRAQA